MEKYFEPKIEDLYVGYECEITYYKNNENTYWIPSILDLWTITTIIDEKEGGFRTSYLTKEQIENEGWNLIYKEDFIIFKNKLCCIFLFPNNYINIYNEYGVIFQGKIRCINEFRKLMKFLEIK